MRSVAAAALAIGILGLVPSAIGAGPKPKPPALGAARILYTSDWGPDQQIYTVDPSGRAHEGQLTFGRSPDCGGCGYVEPLPSPDGRLILYWGCGTSSSLYVSSGDGTHPRRLAVTRYHCGYALETAWAGDSSHIAFTINGDVYVGRVGASRFTDLGRGFHPAWSSGGLLAFLRHESGADDQFNQLFAVGPGNGERAVGTATAFVWSPDGRWLAYQDFSDGSAGIFVVHPGGAGRRRLAEGYLSNYPARSTWSADSRYVAFDSSRGVSVADLARVRIHDLPDYYDPLAWSPTADALALEKNGIHVVDARTWADRFLTQDHALNAAWSPDGRSLAYIDVPIDESEYAGGDLRIASLSGAVRTLVAAAGDYGGNISDFVWTRPLQGTHYRPPPRRTIATIAADQVVAPWPIDRIAADGGRVVYASCGHIFMWIPSAGTVVQTEPTASLSSSPCSPPYSFGIYSLAVAGDRVAFGVRQGNSGQSFDLSTGSVSRPGPFIRLGLNAGANDCPGGGLGDLEGSSGLLVFSTWHDDNHCPARTTDQQIKRADPGCAWQYSRSGLGSSSYPVIATSPAGPLAPFDVDSGRIVAGGENATDVLDQNGTLLTAIPVSPLAAQLSGSDVVVLVPGELRDYDATTGTLLHAWPLPEVPSGGECSAPHDGTWDCHIDPMHGIRPRLVLEDAARGLVTYILDGYVHLLRLADGADSAVASGTLARFMDSGLVYADGARLHLVPFDALPLR